VVDPCLLAWLHEPQLLQRDEKELDAYALLPLLARWVLRRRHAVCAVGAEGLCWVAAAPGLMLR
jgi:hypothetical protein